MINAHTHLYSGLAPLGLPTPATPPTRFVQILETIWWKLDRAIDATSLRASARYYVAQALLSGTNGLIDHHESPEFIEGSLDVLADACQELGMRAVLTYGATERNGGREEARRGLAECRRFITENRRPLIEAAVGLHASFTVSDETIEEAGALCRTLEVPLHVHMAEDKADVVDAKKRGYKGPLERLIQLDALPRESILAHGVHLTPDEVMMALGHGAWLVQNPRSNKGNGVGFARNLGEHFRTALGTDGYPSNLWDEADVLRSEAALHQMRPVTTEVRLDGCQELGYHFFGTCSAEDRVVRIDGQVTEVDIAGKPIVRDGRLLTGSLEEIEANARTEAARLWERMRAL